MKIDFRIIAAALLFFVFNQVSVATRVPEGFEGVISKIDSERITIKNEQAARVFNIEQAGICGWPTKKKIADVFKVGDKVIAYYFDLATNRPVPALNIFYSDEAKVRAFQEAEPPRR